MSDGTRVRRGLGRALGAPVWLAAIALLVAIGLAGGRVQYAVAQDDATPMAEPTEGECVALDGAGSAAEGEAESEAVAASPEALPAATPVEDSDVQDAAVAAATNLAYCFNAGDLEAVLTLITPNLLLDKFGFASGAEAAEALGAMDELPAIAVLETGEVSTYEDGRASLDITYMYGDFQLIDARWFMVFEGENLLIDEELFLLPQPDVEFLASLSAAIADDETPIAFPSAASIPAPEAVLVNIANNATEQRVITAVRLSAEGEAALAASIPGEGTPEAEATPAVAEDLLAGATFVGEVALAAGENADLALVGLEPGTYALTDRATPDAPAIFTLTEPVEVELPEATPAS